MQKFGGKQLFWAASGAAFFLQCVAGEDWFTQQFFVRVSYYVTSIGLSLIDRYVARLALFRYVWCPWIGHCENSISATTHSGDFNTTNWKLLSCDSMTFTVDPCGRSSPLYHCLKPCKTFALLLVFFSALRNVWFFGCCFVSNRKVRRNLLSGGLDLNLAVIRTLDVSENKFHGVAACQ